MRQPVSIASRLHTLLSCLQEMDQLCLITSTFLFS